MGTSEMYLFYVNLRRISVKRNAYQYEKKVVKYSLTALDIISRFP